MRIAIAEDSVRLREGLTRDVKDFLGAVRRVGSGGSALDPTIVSTLLRRRRNEDPLAALTPREREVLELMATGSESRRVLAVLLFLRS